MQRELPKQVAQELDRSILDEIGPPLLHLIRNAADHGVESPEERVQAGKSEEGRILLSAIRTYVPGG